MNKDIQIINYNTNDVYVDKIDEEKQKEQIEERRNNIKLSINDININFDWKYKFNKENIYKISIKMEKQLKDLSYLFYNCYYKTMNLYNFDASQAITMKRMFYKCSNLISIDLSNFKTDKVNDMSYMFCGCSKGNKRIK